MNLLATVRERIPARMGRFFGTASITYLGMALSLFSAPVLARSLGADGRGVLAGAFVSIQLLSWVAFLGLPRGMALQSHKREFLSRSGTAVLWVLGPLSATLAYLSADLVSNGDARIALGVRVGAILLVLAGPSQLGLELTMIRGQIWRFNLIRAANVVLPSLAYILVFAVGHLTLVVAYAITLGGQAIAILLGGVFAISALRKIGPEKPPWKFSLRFWSAAAFDSVGGRLDQLLLTALTSAPVVGVYAVAVTCAAASGGLTQALNNLTYSRFAEGSTQDAELRLRRRALHGVLMSLVSSTFVVLAVALFGTTIFGSGYDDLLPITTIMVLVQLLNDQWTLRVFFHSANENASSLATSSAVALLVLVAVAVGLALSGKLSGETMAIAALAFGLTRLGARWLLSSRKSRDSDMA